jgi:ribonuclease HI
MQYRLNKRCTNNQAEQMTILKALEYIQNIETERKIALVHTDSKITLQLLKTKKKHTNLIERIRTKVQEMEHREWRV